VALPDWVAITGVVGAVLTTMVSAFRVRPDSRKMRDDGTAGLMTSTGAILTSVQEEMHELRAEVRMLREAGRVHSRWDTQVVRQLSKAGIEVDDPPPLFNTSDGR
jgi:hypothetical protein